MLDAALAELVQTLAHDARILIDTSADLTKKGCVLDLLEKLDANFLVVWLVKYPRFCDGLQKVQFYRIKKWISYRIAGRVGFQLELGR